MQLTDAESHFSFGENWANFARLIDDDRIAAATASLRELVGENLVGKSFLDIGCGSGLSSLAAARLGASAILATDIDPMSAKTAEALLAAHLASERFLVETISVFDMEPSKLGRFDVVHSWGVLHHTGAMWRSIERASELTKPGGVFVISIYKKTPFCNLWKLEKRFYSHAPYWVQSAILRSFRALFYARQLTLFRNPWLRAIEYGRANRGMNEMHDFHDWLGGYPYESATAEEISHFLSARGFHLERAKGHERRGSGLFGTGCAEYVFRRGTT